MSQKKLNSHTALWILKRSSKLGWRCIPVTKLLTKLPNLLFKNFGGVFMYMNEENSSTFKMLKTTGEYKFIARKKLLDTSEIQKLKKFYSSEFSFIFLKKILYMAQAITMVDNCHSLSPGELGLTGKEELKD